MTLLNRRGQSIGEYAILTAIVLGAVVAMQQFVRDRIARRIQDEANRYSAQRTTLNTSSSQTSSTSMGMTSARRGTASQTGTGTSTMVMP